MYSKVFILILISSFFMLSCEDESNPIPVTDLKLSDASLGLMVDATTTINVLVNPSNADNQTITWTSDDPSIATVNQDGILKGVKPGTTTITATIKANDVSAQCQVKVVKLKLFNELNGLVENKINHLATDAEGNLWCCGDNISRFNGSVSEMYKTNVYPSAIAVTNNNEVWFGTNGSGALKFNGSKWTVFDSSNSGLKDNSIVSLYSNWNGEILFSHFSRQTWSGTGVTEFDGNNWNYYNSEIGLIYDNVYSMGVDAENTKWFVTSKGISSVKDGKWNSYTSSNTNNDLVDFAYLVSIDKDGNKWFGTNFGILKFDDKSWTSNTIENSDIIEGEITAISFDKNNNVWVGTFFGISCFDGKHWTSFKYDRHPLIDIKAIAIDSENRKWIGTSKGLILLED